MIRSNSIKNAQAWQLSESVRMSRHGLLDQSSFDPTRDWSELAIIKPVIEPARSSVTSSEILTKK